LRRKHQSSYGKSAFEDDWGENDHFFGMIFVQELLMDPKKIYFFFNFIQIFVDVVTSSANQI
jgi:hypothetical protein